jgi:type II secretion system protein I
VKRQVGFTLIEVVVAFVLLSLVLATSFEIFSRGMARSGDLDDQSRALGVAQSRLAAAALEGPLKEGDTSGEAEDRRFQWTLAVRRYEEPSAAPTPAPAGPYALYRVEVRVSWRGADTREHSFSLATLAIGASP